MASKMISHKRKIRNNKALSFNRHLYHSIQLVLKYPICFLYFAQRKAMRDERCGVNPTLLYQTQHLLTIASVASINTGFGFSTKANLPFSIYVYAIIKFLIQII